jgi:hypothetical protein
MPDELPHPGDTIEITWDHPEWLGRQFVVVECPSSYYGSSSDDPSHAWIRQESKSPSYFRADSYKIVARGNGFNMTNSELDRSLDKQRDDNLRGVFT